MGELPRLSDEYVERVDDALTEIYGYPENTVNDVDIATKLKWLMDEVEDSADSDS